MGIEVLPGLRGFDSYEVSLGDELRGERASKGKSLLDVQRELRIKADYIAAIEGANAGAFPHAGFASGYVRAYARYLDLDEDEVYGRFCAESGFGGVAPTEDLQPKVKRPPAPARGGESPAVAVARPKPATLRNSAIDRAVSGPRFSGASNGSAREAATLLRSLGSVLALAAVVAALGYGGWSLLRDIQRLGFAPLPTAPEVLVVAPNFAMPEEPAPAAAAEAAPDSARASLAAIYAAQEAPPPVVALRDGPISSIDPRRAGIYATPDSPAPQAESLAEAEAEADAASAEGAAAAPAALAAAAPVSVTPAALSARGVDVLALEDAWVRVRDGERRVLFTGILGPGEHFTLPADAAAPELRAGNAGAVYIVVDGEAFGPLGSGPEVAKNVDLSADAIRAAYPRAAHVAAPPPPPARAAEAPSEGAVALRSE